MSEITRKMKSIYYSDNNEYLDWMGFKITNDNYPSYHHIIKAEDLRKNDEDYIPTVSNGAYLGKKSHELLHRIEKLDKELYDSWNDLFLIINRMGIYPIDDVWKMVFELQEKSLEIDSKDRN